MRSSREQLVESATVLNPVRFALRCLNVMIAVWEWIFRKNLFCAAEIQENNNPFLKRCIAAGLSYRHIGPGKTAGVRFAKKWERVNATRTFCFELSDSHRLLHVTRKSTKTLRVFCKRRRDGHCFAGENPENF